MFIDLSKHLSYILRHDPDAAGISLDEKGYASIDEVLSHLKDTEHSWVELDEIKKLIEEGEHERFEINEDKIRALYGHSIDVEIGGEFEPSECLYHGTSPESLPSIFKRGLKPMGRNHVHLSRTKKEAYRVGKRHHAKPVVLKIKSKEAYRGSIVFYDRGEVILTPYVPPEYIERENSDPKG
ncbi:MAG: RNA 2'-phosphotransferase [Candidatus Saliniplasma sp.]